MIADYNYSAVRGLLNLYLVFYHMLGENARGKKNKKLVVQSLLKDCTTFLYIDRIEGDGRELILYHGTNEKRGKQILSSGLLSANAPKIYNDDSTYELNGIPFNITSTDGIFLSPNLSYALNYGNNACYKEKQQNVYVFKIDVPSDKLSVDTDEMKLYFMKHKITNYDEVKCDIDFSIEELHSIVLYDNYPINNSNSYYLTIPSFDPTIDNANSLSLQNNSLFNATHKMREYENNEWYEELKIYLIKFHYYFPWILINK